MKKSALFLAALVVVLTAQVGGAIAEDSRTLTGEFVWSQRENRGDLEVIFTPTGEDRWDVAFHFTFRGQPHVYSGTAEGSLSEGSLQGTVNNEDKRRTFTFKGKFEDGKFTGTHAEVGDGQEQATGTLTLAQG